MQAYANPQRFLTFARKLTPWTWGAAATALIIGLYLALVAAPPDYQQGDAARIMYVHVPAAWMAMFVYGSMAMASAVAFIWKHPLADVAAKASAPIGAVFTALALVTGMLWGQPMWGTWWVWDARLTSELLLLFLYLGYMALRASFDDPQRADRASAVLALVGVINVPIIHFSVEWWSTLHQPASVTKLAKPSVHIDMLIPLFIMMAGFQTYFGWIISRRLRGEILRRERNATWLKEAN